jgi:tRNA-modifying protein YgfZ
MQNPSRAARQGALLVEQPLSTLVLSGPDRREWLNGLVTCDVKAIEPGAGAWGLALTKQGKILSDLNLVATTEALYLGVPPLIAPGLYETLSGFLIMEDAELAAPSAELGWIALHGPMARELGQRLAGDGAWGAIDWTGLGGAALVVPRTRVPEVLAAASTEGDVAIGSAADWERLRVERAVPVYGTDYDERDNPHDASLERRAVSWTKGCYLGQEVVCMQDMRGKLKRRLVTLALEGEATPEPGAVLDADGNSVGQVTSRTFSELLAKTLVLARVSAKALDAGRLFVAGRPAALVAPAP